MKTFIKPTLRFFIKGSPAIGVIIQYDYERAETEEEVYALVHRWLDRAENTVDKINKQWYEMAAHNLYSILTWRTYQSKLSI